MVDFDNDSRLEVLTTSSGYEGWLILSPTGDEVIGRGGVDLINTAYRSREVMLVHGVTLDANYEKVVDIYSLTPQTRHERPRNPVPG